MERDTFKEKLRRIKNAKLSAENSTNQSQSGMDWVVRHCSPDTIILNPTSFDNGGHKPNTLGIGDWCAPVDWRSVRLKDDN